jgi:hypothetical protein
MDCPKCKGSFCFACLRPNTKSFNKNNLPYPTDVNRKYYNGGYYCYGFYDDCGVSPRQSTYYPEYWNLKIIGKKKNHFGNIEINEPVYPDMILKDLKLSICFAFDYYENNVDSWKRIEILYENSPISNNIQKISEILQNNSTISFKYK